MTHDSRISSSAPSLTSLSRLWKSAGLTACGLVIALSGIARADCFSELANLPAGHYRTTLAVTNNSSVSYASFWGDSLMQQASFVPYSGWAHAQYTQYFNDRRVSSGANQFICPQGFSVSAADTTDLYVNASGYVYLYNDTWHFSESAQGMCLGANIFTFSVSGTTVLVSFGPLQTSPVVH